jgi:hypothetical protein
LRDAVTAPVQGISLHDGCYLNTRISKPTTRVLQRLIRQTDLLKQLKTFEQMLATGKQLSSANPVTP